MSYHANISMADFLVRQIMPKIWEKRPSVKLLIVGKDPPASITALQADPRIAVTGTVADMRPYLQTATVAAVPLVYGAGIQNKALEAMACKTPVVTNMKAMIALQAKPGEDVLVADTAEGFSRELLRLIENPSLTTTSGAGWIGLCSEASRLDRFGWEIDSYLRGSHSPCENTYLTLRIATTLAVPMVTFLMLQRHEVRGER